MDDLSEKLAGLLNDPETMERVRQMAENLLGDNSQPTQESAPPSFNEMLPAEELGTIFSIINTIHYKFLSAFWTQ